MDYASLATMAPYGKLQMKIDEENRGALHSSKIASQLDEQVMANKLCPRLGLSQREIRDIQRQQRLRDNPQGMR